MTVIHKEIIISENQDVIIPLLWTGKESEISYSIILNGRGAKITFLALLLGKYSDTLQLNMKVIHQAQNTKSEVIVRSTLADSAQVIFNGLVSIASGAKGSNAWLAAHMLLLSTRAKGQAIPSLEILENDIKAGHATTVGRVDNNELFYLMSRGIPKQKAKTLIVEGFLQSMISHFPKNLVEKARKEFGSSDEKPN